MSQGTLADHLRAKTHGATTLSWGQRLQIAITAAQGLEYLHTGCRPPLVHRDVKSANILLSGSLEAKIADFGLTRAFDKGNHPQLSTAVAGTVGYLDPEYCRTCQISEKSDVYSFGVVIFELITGQPPVIVIGEGRVPLVQQVRQRLAEGNVEDVVDAKLQREYDINSMWKAAELALRCTEHDSRKRPTMTGVVAELKESLALQTSYYISESSSTSNNSETASQRSQTNEANNAFEVEDPRFTPSAR